MRSFRTISITLLLAAFCLSAFAQTGGAGGINICPTNMICGTTSSGGDANWLASSGTLRIASQNLIIGNSSATITFGPVPAESRKYDGNGPTLALIARHAAKLNASELAPDGYYELAKSLNLGVSLDEARMTRALFAQGISVYRWEDVDGYLYREALRMKANTRWVWKPARDKDAQCKELQQAAWRTTDQLGFVYPTSYHRRIPIEAMAKMKALADELPDAVFLISDYEVIRPDPFLAISTPALLEAGKIWIIDQWDEPGFKAKPHPQSSPDRAEPTYGPIALLFMLGQLFRIG